MFIGMKICDNWSEQTAQNVELSWEREIFAVSKLKCY